MVKLFSIGLYSAILGQDRSIEEVCKLIKKPRTKKEAKAYYKIESEDAQYQEENEDTVSEMEIQNIRAHYKKLGKNEDAYVDSFNSIADQYADSQLKVIIKFLPLNVRAILETKSPKYQSLMSFGGAQMKKATKETKKEEALKIDFIENQTNKPKMTRPVIVPSAVNTKNVTKLSRKEQQETPKQEPKSSNNLSNMHKENEDSILQDLLDAQLEDVKPIDKNKISPKTEESKLEAPKRGRGRPKKVVDTKPVEENKAETKIEESKVETPKRGRGRPKKIVDTKPIEEDKTQNNVNLFDLYEEAEQTVLPGLEETMEQKIDNLLPGFETKEEKENFLPGLEEIEENIQNEKDIYKSIEDYNKEDNNFNYSDSTNNLYNNTDASEILETKATHTIDIKSLLSKDKKIVSFVGTTKNGTSFLVNNLGELFSSMGINTAILDATKNKNSYFIYTRNEEELRRVAMNSMKNLSMGQANGIQVNKNLTVYTSLPAAENNENYEEILETLVKNYSLVLIDCDFNTDITYFENSQEIYLVQSMDILTIQSLTAFLRDLKSKNILLQDKIRIVINKQTKIRGLNPKVVIGGMAYYNDPSMSFMTELFNKDHIRYCVVPFDEQVYSKYLEGLVNCNVSLNGYSKNFTGALKELGNMVYPLLNNKYKPVDNYDRKK